MEPPPASAADWNQVAAQAFAVDGGGPGEFNARSPPEGRGVGTSRQGQGTACASLGTSARRRALHPEEKAREMLFRIFKSKYLSQH